MPQTPEIIPMASKPENCQILWQFVDHNIIKYLHLKVVY